MLGGTIHDNLNALDVGLPSKVGASVRVAHLDAESNTLIAKFALCHLMLHLLAYNNPDKQLIYNNRRRK
jgi:hypothetical protein